MIKGKSPEEIRSTFGITNDFTPEEEAKVGKSAFCHVDPRGEQVGCGRIGV